MEVLPVTTVPSGSTMAPAGPPVVSSFSSAAERAGEWLTETPAWFISSSSFSTCLLYTSYCQGEATLDDAVASTVQKIDLYRAE